MFVNFPRVENYSWCTHTHVMVYKTNYYDTYSLNAKDTILYFVINSLIVVILVYNDTLVYFNMTFGKVR